MNILRKLLGNDAVLSEPPATKAAPETVAPQSQASKEDQWRAEIAGADPAKLTELALSDKRAGLRLIAAESLAAAVAPHDQRIRRNRTWRPHRLRG